MLWTDLPLSTWIQKCLPTADVPDALQVSSFVVDMLTERRMYPGLEKGLNGILNTIGCREFTAISTDSKADTPGSPESQDYNPLKPDMIVVPTAQKAKKVPMSRSKSRKVFSASENDVFSVAAAPTPSTGPQNTLPLRNSAQPGATSAIFTLPALPDVPTLLSANTTETSKARMAWASAEVVLQVKNSEDSFPFFRNRNDEFSRAESRVQSRGQLAEYALEVFRHQHRLFLFAIAIGGSTAAFVRFDRRGAVVSGIFNYIDDPQPLGEFFYRLFRSGQDGMSLPRELRGHDPTAEPACESCTALFRGLHETRKESLDTVEVAGLKKAATKGWPIYCLMIESPWAADGRAVQPNDAVETHRILVGRPLFSSPYMMGRGTRGFVGWDIDADRQVFVKDSWRAESSRLCSEMDVYYELWRDETSHDVKETHIPTILAGGNVRDVKNGGSVQSTCTQDLVRLTVPETPRVHSRIVMKEIGRRLKDFEHPFELANGIYGALLAHQRAWEKKKILHRDVSINNILLLGSMEGSVGLLCDWDLAKTEQQPDDNDPAQGVRLGTWQSTLHEAPRL